MRVDASTLHLDVGDLAIETKGSVEDWIQVLEAHPSFVEAVNAARNLPSLVKVTPIVAPATRSIRTMVFNKTN